VMAELFTFLCIDRPPRQARSAVERIRAFSVVWGWYAASRPRLVRVRP
jgi:hypothetical protein